MSASTTQLLVTNHTWDTESLIIYLKGQNFKLDENDFAILRNEKNCCSLLSRNDKEDFKECGLKLDLTILLAKEAKFFEEKPKLPSSSYLSLEEMLEKYDMIRKENSAEFKPCVDDIHRRIKNMGQS
ncbi:hypothetical protein RhiirA5_413439 [Rhizophagus irregularis]|uniref:Uncharacterized protein n=1 Tax=Rhizophagus irregularis TaxID=588596 RepID=A0A2N0PWG4_9GLOM|nr:hypothetical protein RhiirA5_413439 [Rhizophagus irregularis]